MRYTQNLHTHTVFCDGKNTPEELVLRALELGFDTLGFSRHSPMHFSPRFAESSEKNAEYFRVVRALQKQYADRIDILCGLEYDMLSDFPQTGCDYLIGSSHYLHHDGEYLSVDSSMEKAEYAVRTHFGGDGLRYAEAYYENFSHLREYGAFDIVGHFDIVTKYSEKLALFDVDAPRYRTAAIDCLRELAKHFNLFEVNTGAIGRGWRTSPYPAPFLLKEMRRLDCSVILTSDCHNMEYLDCAFNSALEYIRSCGYTSVTVHTPDGFRETNI